MLAIIQAEGMKAVSVPYLRAYAVTSSKSPTQLKRALTKARELHKKMHGEALPRAKLHATTDDLEWADRLDRLQRCMGMLGELCPPVSGDRENGRAADRNKWRSVKSAFATILLPCQQFSPDNALDWMRARQTYMCAAARTLSATPT